MAEKHTNIPQIRHILQWNRPFWIFTFSLEFWFSPGLDFFIKSQIFVNIFLEDLAKLLLFVNINTEIWKWVNSTENIRKYTSKLPKILWISTRFLFEYTFVRNEMTVVSVEIECRNHFWTQWCAFSSRQTLPAFLSVLILVYSRWIPGKASTKKSCAFVPPTMQNTCLMQENTRLQPSWVCAAESNSHEFWQLIFIFVLLQQ